MAEVGYLLGAGASAECVPVVKQMGNPENNLSKKLFDAWNRPGTVVINNQERLVNNLMDVGRRIIKDIEKKSAEHSSIDTYAKKLYISRNKAEYEQFKIDLSFYFTLTQILNAPDKRYDNFWASILTGQTPPKKVNIFSWNYDFQVEKSYIEFAGLISLNQAWNTLNICSPGHHMYKGDEEHFHFTKLNGSARFRNESLKNNGTYYCNFESSQTQENIKSLFEYYYKAVEDRSQNFTNELKFAWEEFPRNMLLESINPVLEKIEVLVVIGYSFPFFNRKVDMELFQRMSKLKKIIIQDLQPNWIQERIAEFIPDTITIELKTDKDQFVFPKELEV